jgi:hypothetical protein
MGGKVFMLRKTHLKGYKKQCMRTIFLIISEDAYKLTIHMSAFAAAVSYENSTNE